MKIVRYLRDGGAAYGMLADGTIYGLAVSPFDPAFDAAAPALDGTQAPLSETELLTPCVPTKYLGVGLNSTGAAKAVGRPIPTYPITFLKPTGAVIASGKPIQIPVFDNCKYLYEGELAVVIKKEGKRIPKEKAMDYVLGCTCSNDVTDFTQVDRDALRFKCADTFGPIGPCIDTEVDPSNARIRSWVNGQQRQDGNTSEMIFDVPYMISFFSEFMTLYPGDVISMGTPAGAGQINPGDKITIEVEGIGVLENTVEAI